MNVLTGTCWSVQFQLKIDLFLFIYNILSSTASSSETNWITNKWNVKREYIQLSLLKTLNLSGLSLCIWEVVYNFDLKSSIELNYFVLAESQIIYATIKNGLNADTVSIFTLQQSERVCRLKPGENSRSKQLDGLELVTNHSQGRMLLFSAADSPQSVPAAGSHSDGQLSVWCIISI